MTEEKINNTIVILALITIFILLAYFAVSNNWFTTRSSFDDAEAFFNVLSGVINKDSSRISTNAQQGVTFIGMFILVFLLLFFGMSTSLKHLFNQKVRIFVAFLVSIYGFTNNLIYSYMVDFVGYIVGIVVFLALILVLWGGFKSMKDL